MKHIQWLCLLIPLALMACASTTRFSERQLTQEQPLLAPGSLVTVITKQGQQHAFRIIEITPQALVGRGKDGQRVTLPRADIASVEVSRKETGKIVAWAAFGTAAIVYAIAAFINSLDDNE